MKISFGAFPAMVSLHSPLQDLKLRADKGSPFVLNNSSLQVLQKWNSSLECLEILLTTVRKVEDRTFIWTPNLLLLNLSNNQIKHIANDAFYGLNSLQQLLLSHNSLTDIPCDALEVFKKSSSLQQLDLNSNNIAGSIDHRAFSAISSTLRILKLQTSNGAGQTDTNWISVLQNLTQLTLTFNDAHSDVFIESEKPLVLLHTIQIINFRYMRYETPLCTSFPALHVATLSSDIDLAPPFPLLDTVQGCSNLKELDLSGTLRVVNLVDFQHLNISIPSLRKLKLAQNKLTSIKLIFFIYAPNLANLNLAGNLLETIDGELAYRYSGLVNLNVQNNELASLSGLQHLVFLQNLNAAGNQITVVPTWLLKQASNIKALHLGNNPFQCTCGDIETFREWVLTDRQTQLHPGQYICATPDNLKGMSITAIKLDCRSKLAYILSITIPCVLLVTIVLNFRIRYQWHIKRKLFLLYRDYQDIPDIDEDFEMLQLRYHAYVAYSDRDEAWVMDDLRPNIEEGPDPLQLCIKGRNFVAGHSILDNINEGIQLSRKTILVLSPNFVECEWCYQEMEMAKTRQLDGNLDVFVLVLLDDIPEDKKTLTLRELLWKKKNHKWPKNREDRAAMRSFWRKLRQDIKGPIRVDPCFR